MDGDDCGRFDRLCHQRYQNICTLRPDDRDFSSLNTVRTLHQTSVTLREELRQARSEIQSLRNQIQIRDDIEKARKQREHADEKQPLDDDAHRLETQATSSADIPDRSLDLIQRPQSRQSTELSNKHGRKRLHLHTIEINIGAETSEKDVATTLSLLNHLLIQMASKIQVKIKLTSSLNVDSDNTETTSDTNSAGTVTPRELSTDNDPNETNEASSAKSGKTAEPIETKVEIEGAVGGEAVFSDEAVASTSKNTEVHSSPLCSTSENEDEVDDIEIILSSDDKECPQDDLVSISYFEPWQASGQFGTPVLIKFKNLSLEDPEEDTHDGASSPPIDADAFYNAIRTSAAQLSLESSDSLSVGDNRRQSYDITKPKEDKQTEAESSYEIRLIRDESFDTFEQADYASTGRRWTNYNVLQETDISKVGVFDEVMPDRGRRYTCPNPTAYRPIIHREAMGRMFTNNARLPLGAKFGRNARTQLSTIRDKESKGDVEKRSSAVQTDITLPEHWRSESNLMTGLGNGFFTLPSKFVPTPNARETKRPLKFSEKTRESRRVLLSDINFTSMVPELSRSADHLCHTEIEQKDESSADADNDYMKGPFLNTPDYAHRGITPSMSLTSPGASQWTVNENSFGTQTLQTDNNWSIQHDYSYDSGKSKWFSIDSKLSFDKWDQSKSFPSVRCINCNNYHPEGMKTSQSMHAPRTCTLAGKRTNTRGSLPDLRPEYTCSCPQPRRHQRYNFYGSTESIMYEADAFLRESRRGDSHTAPSSGYPSKAASRRCSENDINKNDFSPSKRASPFLPKSPTCLRPGQLAKVINRNGQVVFGRVRYVGPLAFSNQTDADSEQEIFVGLQLSNNSGDCNGSFEGRRFFDCLPQHAIFVPFKKIVMIWKN